MKITALMENITEKENIFSEHGLSLYIEASDHKILFDMGQTEFFYKNATELNIDISLVDIAVLSHGHYDHGGGLKKFLEVNKDAKVYISPLAFLPYYNGKGKYIGLDVSLKDESRFIYVENEKIIDTSLSVFTKNHMERPNFIGHFGLTKKEEGKYIPDEFEHEQYLLIEENGRKILISGCSHKGIIDIVNWFKPDILVGGFHISKITDTKKLDEIAEALSNHSTKYYTCHCTGVEQYNYLKSKMEGLEYLSSGKTIEI